VVVPILNDDLHEPTESFLARLSLPAGQTGVLLDQDTTTVTIEDDDGKIYLFPRSANSSMAAVYTRSQQNCICYTVLHFHL